MSIFLKRHKPTGKHKGKSSRSSRSVHLYQIKNEARKIREEHAEGKITAEEAARKLRELQSSSHGHIFHTLQAPATA